MLEHRVGEVARGDHPINDEPGIVDRALPEFVIALALANQRAAMGRQNAFDLTDETARYQAAMARTVS